MSRSAVTHLLHHVRQLAGGSASEDNLLADFLARRDESTFAAVMGRHGPMVLSLCQRILRDPHTAEDVFQATFLVFVKRAASIKRQKSLASWLHGVAYRLAIRAKRRHPASLISESDVAVTVDPGEGLAWQETLGILDEELHRLSERYRAPLVLCYLDGCTQDEAARALGWSVGTLRRRLKQGRELLHTRLRGRGVSPRLGMLAAGRTKVPELLQVATVAAMTAMKQGGGIMSSTAAKMLLVLTALCGTIVGAGFWAYGFDEGRPEPKGKSPAKTSEADVAIERAARAVEKCKEPSFALLKELAVLEARRGNKANAHRRFKQAAAHVASTQGYTRAIFLVFLGYGVASAGDLSTATTLLEEARRLARALKRNNTQYEILRFATVCCGERISTTKALVWAKEIPDKGYRLNAFRKIAVAQANAGDVSAALRTVERIGPPLEMARLTPWQAVAAAQLKAGDRTSAQQTLNKALAMIERHRAENRDTALASEVELLLRYAVAQARSGNRAAKTLQRVEKLLAPGARRESLTLLASLARAQVQAGEKKAARRTVERCLKIKQQYGYDNTPATLILAQIQLGDFDRSVKLARDLTQRHERYEVFQALAEAGQQQRAVASAQKARSPEARAWALLGVANGVLNHLSVQRRPSYPAGTFALVIPHKPPLPEPEKQDPTTSAQSEMQSILREWEKLWAQFNERFKRAKSPEERQKMYANERPKGDRCGKQLLALAKKHRGQPIAFEALAWIVEFSSLVPGGPEALSILLRDHLTAKKIGEVCMIAGTHLPHDPNTEKLIRATLTNGPHHAAKGEACLALACLIHDRARQARYVQQHPEAKNESAKVKGLRNLDPVKLESEAEKFYKRVLAEFADVFPSRHGRSLGKAARAALNEIRLLGVGKVAPDIVGKDLDGKPLRLKGHRGKVVLLVFWATWCGPCRQMIPFERALVKRLSGKPFVLLGINADTDRDALQKWRKKNPLPWRSWWDSPKGAHDGQGRIARAWNVSSWPTVYVLDHRGVIRYKDLHGKDLDKAIDSLLKEVGK